MQGHMVARQHWLCCSDGWHGRLLALHHAAWLCQRAAVMMQHALISTTLHHAHTNKRML